MLRRTLPCYLMILSLLLASSVASFHASEHVFDHHLHSHAHHELPVFQDFGFDSHGDAQKEFEAVCDEWLLLNCLTSAIAQAETPIEWRSEAKASSVFIPTQLFSLRQAFLARAPPELA